MLLRQSTKKNLHDASMKILLNLDGDKRTDSRIRWPAQLKMDMRLDEMRLENLEETETYLGPARAKNVKQLNWNGRNRNQIMAESKPK